MMMGTEGRVKIDVHEGFWKGSLERDSEVGDVNC